MKKNTLLVLLAGVFLLVSNISHATLIDQGNGIVYDDVNSHYWYQDISELVGMTFSQQIAYIDAMTFEGKDWRLAFGAEVDQLVNTYSYEEIAAVFTPTGTDIWLGRANEGTVSGPHRTLHIYYSDPAYSGFIAFETDSALNIGAFPVEYVDTRIAGAPGPPALLLLSTGLFGMIVMRRRK